MFMGFCNAMTAVNVINIYALIILQDISDKGGTSIFAPKEQTNIIGFMSPVGAFSAFFTVSYFKRRTLFISCHFLIGVCYILQCVFIEKVMDTIVVVFMSLTIILFQVSQGSGIWAYLAEIGNVQMFGTALLVMNLFTTILSLISNPLRE
jgi:hypothetical protein